MDRSRHTVHGQNNVLKLVHWSLRDEIVSSLYTVSKCAKLIFLVSYRHSQILMTRLLTIGYGIPSTSTNQTAKHLYRLYVQKAIGYVCHFQSGNRKALYTPGGKISSHLHPNLIQIDGSPINMEWIQVCFSLPLCVLIG